MSQDPLQLIPAEKWSELKDVFQADWPRGISVFMLLERQRYLLDCGLDYGFKVYCPFGDVGSGMVAVNLKKTYYELIVQCPNDNTSKLEEALNSTTIIEWQRELEIAYAPKIIMDCIKRVIRSKCLKIYNMKTMTAYVLDKTSPLFNVTLPKEFSCDLLTLEYLDFLDSTWPYRYPGSDFYFEILIKAKLGYGLFREGKLVSWVFIKEMGALLHLHTVEDERRRGYGELVLKLISDVLIKDGKHVVAFCVVGNKPAAKLYQKLNFQNTMDVDWCKVAGITQNS